MRSYSVPQPVGVATAAIDVWLLMFPNFPLRDATGPIQVFSTASDKACDAGLPLPQRIHLPADGRLDDPAMLDWVRKAFNEATRCCCVRTGSFVFARAGLLEGRRALTH